MDDVLRAQLATLNELQANRRGGHSQPIATLGGSAPQKKHSPFPTFGDFMLSVKRCSTVGSGYDPMMREWDTRLKALPSGYNETVGADGGFLVPPEFANTLLMRIYANDLLSRTTMFPLKKSNSIRIPSVDETSRADGSRYGGVQGYWLGEAETATASKGKLSLLELSVNMLTVAVRVTQELLDDDSAYSMEQYMNVVAPAELNFKLGDAIVNGSGAILPEGLMNSPSKITVSTTTTAAQGLLPIDVQNMWSRLHRSCRENAVWLIDQSLEPYLNLLTLGSGTVQLIYLPPGGFSGQPYGTLLGKPVIVTEFGAATPTTGDIILADMGTYITAMKGGVENQSSMHVYFLSHENVFRFNIRIDGKSWWRSALTPKSGGSTQSNIVTLATRT
jgi:HK97 family phage major capsid protein